MTPLEQKYSCERSEWALCTLINKYKKKDCYNYMYSFTDEASGEPKHFIRLNENKSWKLM